MDEMAAVIVEGKKINGIAIPVNIPYMRTDSEWLSPYFFRQKRMRTASRLRRTDVITRLNAIGEERERISFL